ncbi:MAG: SHOCT domain-containing protein [Ruminococcus sp.]|nr:SHOCT domain-containing protein [Ruminococcus sp.]
METNEQIQIKASFYNIKKICNHLIKGSLIVLFVFLLLGAVLYGNEVNIVKAKATQKILEICFDIDNCWESNCEFVYTEKFSNLSDDTKYDFALQMTKDQYDNVTIDIQGNTYYLKNAVEDWFNSHLSYIYAKEHNEAPESMLNSIVKQYNSKYLKTGNAIKLLKIGVTISLIMFILNFALKRLCYYKNIIITNKMMYVKTLKNKKTAISINDIHAVSAIIANGISVTTSSGTQRFLFIKNKEKVYHVLSSLIKNNPSNTTKITNKNNAIEKITVLRQLLENDLISQQEFDRKKEDILNKM